MTSNDPSAPPSPYADAELYDVIFAGYREDLDFYVSAAKQARGPVLEVGCGTGRVMIPCLQAGADVDGLDLHAEMLAVLKRKAQALGLKVRVYQADMRDFTTPRRYALVTIPFNAFVHNLTTQDQLKTLRVCREHLEPGGALTVSLFHPRFDLITAPEGVPVLETETTHPQTGRTLRLYDTRTMDRVNQIQHSNNEIQELDAEGNVIAVHRSETAMRWTYKAEMELLLHVAGYARWQTLGGFDGRPLARDDDQMVVTAWRD
jgi:SAM-dependent methyltransferase